MIKREIILKWRSVNLDHKEEIFHCESSEAQEQVAHPFQIKPVHDYMKSDFQNFFL